MTTPDRRTTALFLAVAGARVTVTVTGHVGDRTFSADCDACGWITTRGHTHGHGHVLSVAAEHAAACRRIPERLWAATLAAGQCPCGCRPGGTCGCGLVCGCAPGCGTCDHAVDFAVGDTVNVSDPEHEHFGVRGTVSSISVDGLVSIVTGSRGDQLELSPTSLMHYAAFGAQPREFFDEAEAAAVREIRREMAIEAGDDSEALRQEAEDDARAERAAYLAEREAQHAQGRYDEAQCLIHPGTAWWRLRYAVVELDRAGTWINDLPVYGSDTIPLYSGVHLPGVSIYGNADALEYLAAVLADRAAQIRAAAEYVTRGEPIPDEARDGRPAGLTRRRCETA